MKPKIGLFAGGIEQYWKQMSMKGLPSMIDADARRLVRTLERENEVFYPGLCGNTGDAARAGKALREAEVDLAVMYHATYLDDAMSVAFLEEASPTFPVLLLSQGYRSFLESADLTNFARSWGTNSAVQLPGTLKRMKPELRYGFVFGWIDSPRVVREICEYARAARAVRLLKGKLVSFLPHRSLGVPMYDTFPDETKMMGQTGIRLDYMYIIDLVKGMEAVSDSDVQSLAGELYEKYEIVEPSKEEVLMACRQAIALDRMVAANGTDALAIEMCEAFISRTRAIPCVGMARLIDRGVIVTTEGDLSVAIAGLLIKELTGKPIHFWEHLSCDEDRNWILGGHEGGSAGFSMAKAGTRPRLRGTQYVNFDGIPGAPHLGVFPEFITNPGPVTLLTFFRGPEAYEMRIACGESIDHEPLPVHYEHTIFKPRVPLPDYFAAIKNFAVCHHLGLVHADIEGELKKVAEIMGMKLVDLTRTGAGSTVGAF